MVSLAESAAFVAYEASSAASALEAWSAEMAVSRLASCVVARPSRAFAILVSTSSGSPSTVGGQRAGVRLAEEGGVQTRRGGRV